MSRAIVVGAAGQDGRILSERLISEGCEVLGIARDSGARTDIADAAQVSTLVAAWQPDRIYYLAAHHHSSQDATGADTVGLYEKSHAVHVRGLLHFLEAMRASARHARLFYAASSLVFGDATSAVQDESTPLNPRCIYGITKAAGLHCCRFYRETHGVFASGGILFNHESPYRQEKFVSQKIIRAVAAISAGSHEKLVLGDLSARIDWGYAPDFTDAMTRILALDRADDFVVVTGESHSVGEFAEIAFRHAGLDWKSHVEENPSVLQRRRPALVGDASRLRTRTGWRPTVTFPEMVARLVESRLGAARLA